MTRILLIEDKIVLYKLDCNTTFYSGLICLILLLNPLLNLSSWCLVMVERLFLAVPWGCLQLVIVVFPDHTHLLFLLVGTWKIDSWNLHNPGRG